MRRKRRRIILLLAAFAVISALIALWLRLAPEVEALACAQVADEASDVIAEAFGGDEKKAEAQASGRRGRRGRRGEADSRPLQTSGQETASPEGKNRIVTDPVLDAPMTVTLTLTVHDFRSLEEKPEEEGK